MHPTPTPLPARTSQLVSNQVVLDDCLEPSRWEYGKGWFGRIPICTNQIFSLLLARPNKACPNYVKTNFTNLVDFVRLILSLKIIRVNLTGVALVIVCV